MFPTGVMGSPSNAAAGAMMPMMMNPAAMDKVNRELFVGNTPPGTNEVLLMEFFNGAMRRTGLCPPRSSPVVQCRVNTKFAFVECASVDDVARALNLNGIPFLGFSLRVGRPAKYSGPHVPSVTWQQLTGLGLPDGVVPDASGGGGGGTGTGGEDKIVRELFVGNTTPDMTEQGLREFLGKAMEQVGLSAGAGNPILACRLSGKFAFVELRSKEETAAALNLNNIPYLSTQLRVGRPSKYTGPLTPHGNWEDILQKYISGELQLPSQGGSGAADLAAGQAAHLAAATGAADVAAPAELVGPATNVVVLANMLGPDDLSSDADYEDILEDTKEECAQFGSLKDVVIPRIGEPGEGKIFLEYMGTEHAAAAIRGLQGRTFDGRKVEAKYFDPEKFAAKDYNA
eukprot:CAMPEP_0194267378 /NCGR_PEP_ID=MMETSP0169-20130528/1900_1 /TAXON_ID=218684 /ORGANISM="Corethron pennatum, Strain L29A3" /LENGTH=399 /DNA_ID=CAMNT_0039008203 /DNA_START=124 /DNA_END=1323 /DNA_ORIENTATION=+